MILLMKDAVDLFRALADEERLRILNLLLTQKEGVCVCELVDALRIPQYQVSRQLGVVRNARLVSCDRQGTWAYYRISSDLPPLARAMLKALAEHLHTETVREDRQRFERRLELRVAGVCTLGYASGLPFRDAIPIGEIEPV
jgi:ArsR family transcriptional regulator